MRLSAPEPVANAIGKLPKIVDKLVIRIGRKRPTDALITASTMFNPCLRH
jgi:hypothetical protein